MLIAIFLIIFSSCFKKKEIICPSFSIENRNIWISDSTGCLNKRLELINKDVFKYKNFINRDVSCIKSQLGNWNSYYKFGKIDYYCYFLTCKYVPVVKGSNKIQSKSLPISNQVMLLKFGVLKNKVFSASIIQP